MIHLDLSTGNRIYLRGDTYKLRDKIKAIGGHWDPDQRAWWVGAAKRGEADRLVAIAGNPVQDGAVIVPEALPEDTKIVGKAEYKGRQYLILWEGEGTDGRRSAKLTFRDGTRQFWVHTDQYVVTKVYPTRDYRGRPESMTLGKLKRLAQEYRAARAQGKEACHKCGSLACVNGGGCYMCGCRNCDGSHGGLCEDD